MRDKPQCFVVPKVSDEEHEAIRCLSSGTATEYQQTLALHLITNKIARAHDTLFIPNAPDETAFLSGRAYVGAQILKMLNIPVGRLYKQREEDVPTNST